MENINITLYAAKETEHHIAYYFTVNNVNVDTVLYHTVLDTPIDYNALLGEACSYAALCYMGREV